ncbi:MAG: hypothetical protein ACTSVG_00740 [Alphaproteobacteria bacterium]
MAAFMGQRQVRHKVPASIGWQQAWTAEGRRAILWLPVLMGFGIWLYFTLEHEPDPLWCALTALPTAALVSGMARRGGLAVLALALVLSAFGAGFSLASLAAHRAQAPMLSGPIQETVEGRLGRTPGAARSGRDLWSRPARDA